MDVSAASGRIAKEKENQQNKPNNYGIEGLHVVRMARGCHLSNRYCLSVHRNMLNLKECQQAPKLTVAVWSVP